MKRILIFQGSPRKKGNSELLAEAVITGLQETQTSCHLVRLAEQNIHPCVGCGTCERKGICVFHDDMDELYDAIEACDAILLCSPIYFYGVTAQTKLFIDRCLALWSRKYVLKQYETRRPRSGYFLSVAATRGKQLFSGATLTAKYALDAMHCRYEDQLLVPGMDAAGIVQRHPDVLQQARELGRRIGAS